MQAWVPWSLWSRSHCSTASEDQLVMLFVAVCSMGGRIISLYIQQQLCSEERARLGLLGTWRAEWLLSRDCGQWQDEGSPFLIVSANQMIWVVLYLYLVVPFFCQGREVVKEGRETEDGVLGIPCSGSYMDK